MSQPSKRDKILEAAGILFMNQGFQAVSVDQIAAAVPVSKPTLYAHFKDKRELFTAVINMRCQSFISTLRAGIESGETPDQALYNFACDFMQVIFSRQSLEFHRIMIGESLAFPEMAKLFYETGPRNTQALLSLYLGSLREKNLHIENPDLSADIFLSMLKGQAHTRCLLGIGKPMSAKDRNRIARQAVNVFINGHSVQKK